MNLPLPCLLRSLNYLTQRRKAAKKKIGAEGPSGSAPMLDSNGGCPHPLGLFAPLRLCVSQIGACTPPPPGIGSRSFRPPTFLNLALADPLAGPMWGASFLEM